MGIACSFKNTCRDNYHDDNSRGTGSVYFLRARSVTHVFGKGSRRARQKSLVYFSAHFLSHRRSSEVRATVIVTAGRCSRLSRRNLAIRSSHRESAPRWRTVVTGERRRRRHGYYLSPRTFSHSQPDPYGSPRIRSTRKKKTRKKIRRRCSTS